MGIGRMLEMESCIYTPLPNSASANIDSELILGYSTSFTRT